VGTAEEVFKVRGQRSRSDSEQGQTHYSLWPSVHYPRGRGIQINGVALGCYLKNCISGGDTMSVTSSTSRNQPALFLKKTALLSHAETFSVR